jgi:hypothetical protein
MNKDKIPFDQKYNGIVMQMCDVFDSRPMAYIVRIDHK